MRDDYAFASLDLLPTLAFGQTDDLKLDDGHTRVWLSRMTPADGATHSREITVEVRSAADGRWVPGDWGDLRRAVRAHLIAQGDAVR